MSVEKRSGTGTPLKSTDRARLNANRKQRAGTQQQSGSGGQRAWLWREA
jgi:hypothetical protein